MHCCVRARDTGRLSADEDGKAESQHVYYPRSPVDDCCRANVCSRHGGGEVLSRSFLRTIGVRRNDAVCVCNLVHCQLLFVQG